MVDSPIQIVLKHAHHILESKDALPASCNPKPFLENMQKCVPLQYLGYTWKLQSVKHSTPIPRTDNVHVQHCKGESMKMM